MKRIFFFLNLITIFFVSGAISQINYINKIVPQPQNFIAYKECFELNTSIAIIAGEELKARARQLRYYLETTTDFDLQINPVAITGNLIEMQLQKSFVGGRWLWPFNDHLD